MVPGTVSMFLFLGYFAFGTAAWHAGTTGMSSWSLIESAYFSMVTLLTIGFGDYVPGYYPRYGTPNDIAMGCCAVYIVIGSIVLTTGVGLAFEAIRHHKKLSRFHRGPARMHNKAPAILYDERHFKDGDISPPFMH